MVEEVVFIDPSSRKRPRTEKQADTVKDGFNLKVARTEVTNYGRAGLSKKSKKELSEEYVTALNGKVAKPPKMPIKMLQGMRKVAAKREKRYKRLNKAGDVVLGSSEKKKRKEVRGREGDALAPVRKVAFRNGVLSVRK